MVQVRIGKELKREVTEIYETMGMNLPTAIRMFFVKSKMVCGLLFDTTLLKNAAIRSEALDKMFDQTKLIWDMTLDEIDAEIADVRALRKESK